MSDKNAKDIFNNFISQKKLKHSSKRLEIMNTILSSNKHFTADELFVDVRKSDKTIGIATVYRTLKLLSECGLIREIRFNNETPRYEPVFGHEHHDHLICTKCGKFAEVVNDNIEKLQNKIAKQYGFILTNHKFELYGLCEKCKKE